MNYKKLLIGASFFFLSGYWLNAPTSGEANASQVEAKPANLSLQGKTPVASPSAAEGANLKPVISRAGALIFKDDFDATKVRKEWVALHGTQWKVVVGALRGQPSSKEYQAKQIARGNKSHSGGTPSSRLLVPAKDCIVLLRFKLADGLNGAHFGFNDGTFQSGTGHVCRLTATTTKGLTLQKDKNAKVEGDTDQTLTKDPFNLKPDTWYWMMLEVVGDQMASQISGGPILKARHPRIDFNKDQVNLPTRGGGTIFYDQVRIWKALPLKK